MLKRMYVVISLLSIAAIMHGMDDEIGKRSVGGVLNDTLDIVVGKVEKELQGTITTVEHEFGGALQEIKQEATLLGVTRKGAYDAAVVFGALYLTAETAKYLYHRYFAPDQEPALDAATIAATQSVATADSNVHVLGKFVSGQQINSIMEAKWLELMKSSTFADKGYVDTVAAQTRNMITSALQTTAGRVTTLEGQVKGLAVVINGDPGSKEKNPGIITSHDILANRIRALENQTQAASSSSSAQPGKGGGIMGGMSKMFGGRKKQKRDDSGVHGDPSHGDTPSHGDDDHDADDDDADKGNKPDEDKL